MGFDDWFGFAGGGMSYWGDTKKGRVELIDVRYSSNVRLAEYAIEAQKSHESLRTGLFRIRKKLQQCIVERLKLEGGIG